MMALMKILRGSNPDEKLIEAQTSLADAEQRIEALEAEREIKLCEPEFLLDVSRIDQELAKLRGDIVIFRQREQKMRLKQRERDRARRIEEKQAAVAAIGQRTAKRVELAQEVDGLLAQLARKVQDLIREDELIYSNWPDVLPDANLLLYTRASSHRALSSRPPQQQLHAGLVRTLADHDPFGFADMVEESNRELLAELDRAAIPGDDDQEIAA